MKKTILICFIVLLNSKDVLTQFYLKNGNYLSYPIKQNWFEAMATCNSLNQQLIVVSTPEKLQEIQYLINSMNFSQKFNEWEDGIWTAGTDLGSEDKFVWITTGKRIEDNEIKWIKSSNLIDNYEDEDCLSLQRDDNYNFVFNDCTCTDSIYFMCEKTICRSVSNVSHDSPVKCEECQ